MPPSTRAKEGAQGRAGEWNPAPPKTLLWADRNPDNRERICTKDLMTMPYRMRWSAAVTAGIVRGPVRASQDETQPPPVW
jgi:hypothetical protein